MYKIVTDNTSDLGRDYIQKNDIGMMFLSYSLDDKLFNNPEAAPSNSEFYNEMRAGKMTKTAAPSPGDIRDLFLEALKDSEGVICIALSSGISGTYSAATLAREYVLEDYPNAKIHVIDSLCASLGEGLLVHYAFLNKEKGMSFEDNVKWLEEHKKNIVHAFTVDDLMFLYRGGRVSKSTAVVGSMIGIKPLLHVDDEGKLTKVGTARGRKKSLIKLVDYMEEHMGSYRDKNEHVFISHGDCIEDAQFVAEEVEARFGIKVEMIDYVGPTIGSHSGPGTMALFFLGDSR